MVFSDADLEIIMWLLCINGVADVPSSIYKIKKMQTSLGNAYPVKVHCFVGVFGHMYFVVRPHLLVPMVSYVNHSGLVSITQV